MELEMFLGSNKKLESQHISLTFWDGLVFGFVFKAHHVLKEAGRFSPVNSTIAWSWSKKSEALGHNMDV